MHELPQIKVSHSGTSAYDQNICVYFLRSKYHFLALLPQMKIYMHIASVQSVTFWHFCLRSEYVHALSWINVSLSGTPAYHQNIYIALDWVLLPMISIFLDPVESFAQINNIFYDYQLPICSFLYANTTGKSERVEKDVQQ